MFFWSFKDVFQTNEYQLFKWFTFVLGMGGKLSRLVYLDPAQDLGQTVSSVNSYCTIILEHLVVRDINIILVKLTCFHPTLSLVTLVRGVGASCPGWFILLPAQDLGQTVSSVNSYCTIILEYLVVWDKNIISVKLRGLHPMFSLVILVWGVGGKLYRLVYLGPRPGYESGIVISQFLLYHNLGIFSCMRYKHYFSQTDMFAFNVQFGNPCPRDGGGGGKLSRLIYLAPRTGFGSDSVISQFLLHHYLGIFGCKRYKHYFSQTEMFTSNVQFGYPCLRGGGGGASCAGWFILPPAQDMSQALSSVNSYCTIILEYLDVRVVNIISVKLRCLHLTFSSVILIRGVGGKLSRLVYLGPRPGFESGIVISQFLLHHNLGIFSCKSCEHYFSQTEMLTSNVQFGYPCPRGGGQVVQAGLLKFWAGGGAR